jgi:hypothetical protein
VWLSNQFAMSVTWQILSAGAGTAPKTLRSALLSLWINFVLPFGSSSYKRRRSLENFVTICFDRWCGVFAASYFSP